MAIIVLKRLAQGLLIVWMTTTMAFFLIHAAPGEPFAQMLEHPRATPELRDTYRQKYGLDRPVAEQYVRFLASVVRGDLGESFTHHRPVVDVLGDAVPRTLLLMFTALTLGFAAGIALGAVQGSRPGRWFDRLTGGAAVIIAALPDFWLALLAVLLFAGTSIPIAGFASPTLSSSAPFVRRFFDVGRHLILPAGTLALLITATVSRYQRAAMIEALPHAWLRSARAKGVPRSGILYRHALRNALLPIITLGGLAVPALLGGAVFVEFTFAWQGMGSLAVQAVGDRDYPLILAIVMLSSVFVVAGAAIADVVTAAADPRQRHA